MAKERAERALGLYRDFQHSESLEALEEAIGSMRRSVDLTQGYGSLDSAAYRIYLAMFLLARWSHSESPRNSEDLEAILQNRDLDDAVVEPHAFLKALHTSTVALALQARFEQAGDIADIREAVLRWERSVELTAPGDAILAFRRQQLEMARLALVSMTDERMREVLESPFLQEPDDAMALSLRSLGHLLRFRQGGPVTEADEAISLLERAIVATDDEAERAKFRTDAARILTERFRRTSALSDLDRAIESLDHVVTAMAADAAERLDRIALLVNAHYARVEATGDPRHIAQAVSLLRLLADTSGMEGHLAQAWLGLCAMLQKQAIRTREHEDIEAAVEAGRAAVDAAGEDLDVRGRALSTLATGLLVAFEILGDQRVLREAAERAAEAVEATLVTDAARSLRLLNAGTMWCRLAEAKGNIEYFDRGLILLDTETEATDDLSSRMLVARQHWRMERYRLSQAVSDLDAAIHAGTAQRTLLVADAGQRAASLRILCTALHARAARNRSLADLDDALLHGQEFLATIAPNDPSRSIELHLFRAFPATQRFEISGEVADLDLSIAADEEAFAACRVDDQGVEIHRALYHGLLRRFQHSQDISDLQAAILHTRRFSDRLSPEHSAQPHLLWKLASTTAELAQRIQEVSSIRAAAGYARAALRSQPEDAVFCSRSRALLIRLLTKLADTGEQDALDEAIEIGDAAVTGDFPDESAALADALAMRHWTRSSISDLGRAIEIQEGLLTQVGEDEGAKQKLLRVLASFLDERHRVEGDPRDLVRALDLLMEAAELPKVDKPAVHLSMSRLLRRRFRADRHAADIERAVRLLEEAIHLLGDSPEQGRFTAQLLACLQDRRELLGPGEASPDTEPADVRTVIMLAGALLSNSDGLPSRESLDSAVEMLRTAWRQTPSDYPLSSLVASNMSYALRTRFTAGGPTGDLDEAIETGVAACSGLNGSEPWGYGVLANLSSAYRLRFLEAGRPSDLEAALEASRAAVPLSPEGEPRVAALAQLVTVLIQRHDGLGSLEDLDEAIHQLEGALAWRHPDGRSDPVALSEYSIALRTRYEVLHTLPDLERAVAAGRESVASPHLAPRWAAGAANNLGLAVFRKAERFSSVVDATEAVDLFRQCVDRNLSDPHLGPGAWGNLAAALGLRYELTKEPSDLTEAAKAAKAAAEAASSGHAEQSLFLSRLCTLYGKLYLEDGDEAALGQAVAYGRLAVRAAPPPHPHEAIALVNLASILRVRGGTDDRQEAWKSLTRAMRCVSAPSEVRAVAARALGRAAAEAGDWPNATAAYAQAIGLREESSRREPAGDSIYQFERFRDLASDAAACHLRNGDVLGAVAIWEKGRAGLLARELQNRHPDLDRLELEDRETAVRLLRLLKAASTPQASSHQVHAEVTQLVEEIRRRAGFENFLAAPRLPDILEIIGAEPMILVTLSDIASYAIVISNTGCRHVELPDLSPVSSVKQLADLEEAVGGTSPDEERLRLILGWLGDSVVAPVLRELKQAGIQIAPDKRLRWILSGWLGMLPVQAALVVPEGGGGRVPAFTLFCPV
ncbi:hypothetical protein ACWD25_18190, partial [Streptomyces sp. NPDC002920]